MRLSGEATISNFAAAPLPPYHACASLHDVGAALSADGVDDHASFCSSEELDFLLLSDMDGRVSKAYGSWMAPYSLRHTFLIDPTGTIRQTWTGVRPTGHAKDVLETLKTLKDNALA